MHVAIDSLAVTYDGHPFVMRKGQTISDDHPVLAKYPELFRAPLPSVQWDGVEEATVNPGEVRHVVPAPVTDGVELVDDSYTLSQLRQLATAETGKGFGDKDALIKRINDKRLKEA